MNDKIYNSWKQNRSKRLDFLARFDHLISNINTTDKKLNELYELRGNTARYTTAQIQEKIIFILNQ